MTKWVKICDKNAVEEEDLVTVEFEGHVYAIYHSPEGEFYCTDGLCTHEAVDLGDGLVMDHVIECPKHNGRFDYRTGEALGAPVCVNLRRYAVRLNGDDVEIEI